MAAQCPGGPAINRMQISMQELVASRSRMIAGMGHDLRTYITRLTLRAEFIGDEAQRAKALGDWGYDGGHQPGP